ncbi:hypothetical protein [Sporosarcina sp. ITBMC105]
MVGVFEYSIFCRYARRRNFLFPLCICNKKVAETHFAHLVIWHLWRHNPFWFYADRLGRPCACRLKWCVPTTEGHCSDTYLQQHATADELPKVYAAQSALVSLLFAIGSVGFGLLAELWDVRITYLLSGVLLLLASVLLYKQRRHLPSIK